MIITSFINTKKRGYKSHNEHKALIHPIYKIQLSNLIQNAEISENGHRAQDQDR